MLGSLVYVADKRADLQKHIELSAEQLLISQRMATFSLGASSGNENDFTSLMKGRIRFDSILSIFQNGAAEVPPLVAEVLPALGSVEESWLIYKEGVLKQSLMVSNLFPRCVSFTRLSIVLFPRC